MPFGAFWSKLEIGMDCICLKPSRWTKLKTKGMKMKNKEFTFITNTTMHPHILSPSLQPHALVPLSSFPLFFHHSIHSFIKPLPSISSLQTFKQTPHNAVAPIPFPDFPFAFPLHKSATCTLIIQSPTFHMHSIF